VFAEYNIRVQRADEPSNILWKNNDYTKTEKLERKKMTRLIPMVFIAISFFVLLAMNLTKSLDGNECSENQLTIEKIQSQSVLNLESYPTIEYCFCRSQTKLDITGGDSKLTTFCETYTKRGNKVMYLGISTGILIVVINIAFLGLVKWLAEYRKFLF